jgi:type I restriction enzyme R subunit
MSKFSEATTVEDPILDWLQTPELGWHFEDRRTVETGYRARHANGAVDEHEVLLLPVLKQKLLELNPGVITDDDRADRILTVLRGLRDNQEWIAWLRNEKTFKFAPDEPARNIRLVDYDDDPLNNNDFLATSQFRVEGSQDNIRTDILLFINGIPLVNIEAKTTGRDWHVDWTEGARQTGRYLLEAPQLYYSNIFCAGVNELVFKYGIPGTKFHTWHQWRDPSPHTIPEAQEMKCSVYGLFHRMNLLDLMRNFVVFEIEQGKAVKKVARYQQFRAANELVKRATELDRPKEWRRGIVWHTQGSGKSLTILFAARKLWHHPDLKQPTVLVVVDRDQLQDQMIGQFIRTNVENCRIAESKADLLNLLRDGEGYRGIIVTIMHKFQGHEQATIDRRNVIALVDEAHRSQEGDFGNWMRSTLTEASLFGFTGTPIENRDHNTPQAFGRIKGRNDKGEEVIERYMDRYSIADSLRDKATLRIDFTPRISDWEIWGEKLDKVFEREFAHLPEGEREQLKRENAHLRVILKLPKRIGMIAEDIAKDFTQRVRPNKFKAMLACYDRETCALYKAALDKLLGEGVAMCIFSEDPERDPAEVKKHYLGDEKRRKAIDEFKKEKPEDEAELAKPENRYRSVEIFIVCDMLLTGFDAPILETMYLDKPLRDHLLLQAIARVNRPYNDLKTRGIILDYFGVFENLNDALNFDRNELGDVAFPLTRLREQFKIEMTFMRELLAEFPRQGDYGSLMKILTWFNVNEPKREKFELGYRNLTLLWETLYPDPELNEFEGDYLWLARLWMYYRKSFYPLAQKFETDPADGAKTREIIRQHVDVDEIKRNLPTYVLDASYLTKLRDVPPDTKALEIEAMLAAELKIRIDEDEDFQPLSERLKIIVQRKRNGAVAGLALLAELEQLTKEVVGLIEESKRPIAEAVATAAKERAPGISDAEAVKISKALLAKADELCFPGWEEQEAMDTDLFRELTVVLAQEFPAAGVHAPDKDFVARCIKLLRKVHYGSKDDGKPSA